MFSSHLAVIVLSLIPLGCGVAFKYPYAEPILNYSAILSVEHKMNRHVLTRDDFDRIIVEIDWVEGAKPAPSAIAAMRRIFEAHVPPGYGVEIVLDDEIERQSWEQLRAEDRLVDFLDRRPDYRPSLEERTYILYVLYLPDVLHLGDERYGNFFRVSFDDDGGGSLAPRDDEQALPVIIIGKEVIHRRALLWLSGDALESTILVHEVGHFFGLVVNTLHETAGLHCTNPRCPMQRGVWRAVLANFYPAVFMGRTPTELGAECKADIELAKRAWAESRAP